MSGSDEIPHSPAWTNIDPSEWDASLAEDLIGQLVLVGLSYCDADGTILEVTQGFGHVLNADRARGIRIEFRGSKDGESIVLPPDTTAFEVAKPGIYRLKSTGETVEDPAYVTSYTITRGKNG